MNNLDESPEDGGLTRQLGEIARSTIERYERSPILRMLVKLCPPVAVAEAGILGTYAWFEHRRLQVFADEFTTLGLNLGKEDAECRKFFDAYTSTARHVLTESRDTKIRLFARLFGEFIKSGCTNPIDRYEEHLVLLDEISEREFRLLLLLHQHEVKRPMQPNENRLQRAARLWDEFAADAKAQLQMSSDELQAVLTRLTRTGMYKEITGNYFDYTGGRGYLTSGFPDFLVALGISPEVAVHVFSRPAT